MAEIRSANESTIERMIMNDLPKINAEQMLEALGRALERILKDETNHPGWTYEQGVAMTVGWLLGIVPVDPLDENVNAIIEDELGENSILYADVHEFFHGEEGNEEYEDGEENTPRVVSTIH
jgi:hypothetical protein